MRASFSFYFLLISVIGLVHCRSLMSTMSTTAEKDLNFERGTRSKRPWKWKEIIQEKKEKRKAREKKMSRGEKNQSEGSHNPIWNWTKSQKRNKRQEKGRDLEKKVDAPLKTQTPAVSLLTYPSYRTGKAYQYKELSDQEMRKRIREEEWFERGGIGLGNQEVQSKKKELGSLWSSEGQGAYLFSENTLRSVGDPITVLLNGAVKQQIISKKNVIEQFLNRKKTKFNYKSIVSERNKKESREKGIKEKDDLKKHEKGFSNKNFFQVESIPTKITEKISQNHYRIEGHQVFLIGRRQYSVLASGVVRLQDLLEDKIEATRLMDAYFDVVKFKKGFQRERKALNVIEE